MEVGIMRKKIISVAIALLFAASAFVVLANSPTTVAGEERGPTGTDNWIDADNYDVTWYDPVDETYEISTAAELAGIAYIVSIDGTTTFSGKTINIAAGVTEIDLGVHYWTPIGYGYTDNTFEGIFDGKNVVIKNMYVGTESTPYPDGAGLFGSIYRGTIKNVGVVGGEIYGSPSAGGIVGISREGKIENCYNTGHISGRNYAGGIIGNAYDGGTVENCYNTGNISGKSAVGGIIGVVYDGGTVENCYNTGNVSGPSSTGDMSQGSTSVGGIVAGGAGMLTVENCYNTGDVSGIGSSGGIISFVLDGSTIKNCYNTGSVSGLLANTGGITGNMINGTVENCYNTGSVTLSSGSSGNIGPIFGNSSGTVTHCYWLDTIGFPDITEGRLTIEQMTGSGALGNMTGFAAGKWVTEANGGEMKFFLQLKVFAESDDEVIKADSLRSVTIGGFIAPTITQSETYKFTEGQKLSDINPGKYVSVPAGIEGTFTWDAPDTVLDTLGNSKAKIIFTPSDTASYNPSSIDVDITVSASGGDNTMLIIAAVAIVAVAGLVLAWYMFIRKP